MNTKFIFSIIALWFIMGWFSYCATFAYFQREYPGIALKNFYLDRNDLFVLLVLGPISLIGAIWFFRDNEFHGFLNPFSEQSFREAESHYYE